MMKPTMVLALAALLSACGASVAVPPAARVSSAKPVAALAAPAKAKKAKRTPAEVQRAMTDKLDARFSKLSMAELRATIELAQRELDVREENADTGSIPAELLDETPARAARSQGDCR